MLYRLITLASRPATRKLFKNTHLRPIAATPSILYRSNFVPINSFHSSVQWSASSHDWNDQKPVTHPLIEKIQQHPHIMEQLIDFTGLLQSKGVDVSGQRPSFVQIMKVMNDPEVKEKVQKLALDMQTAGIQLDMNTIQELQSSFAALSNTPVQEDIINEKKPVVEEEERGRKRGMFSKLKGAFKK
ncbi:uncharacterized protein EV154DRAFT_521268 [Mucor mucedo]|uniref:uncharacterized protein n=1 Tax=Mucor mucedo TaxID=29922 RepID=UPI002220E9D2|nr:uncharacterized protein EV154DRAFT_521268 [Mucor mucedo]KAI7886382.1 hypothetical protein EV154DRAFT_521268 [Mucor mucedo]